MGYFLETVHWKRVTFDHPDFFNLYLLTELTEHGIFNWQELGSWHFQSRIYLLLQISPICVASIPSITTALYIPITFHIGTFTDEVQHLE